jgi:hypothetical protein
MGLGKISLEVCRYLNEMEHVMVKNVQDFFELATVIGRNRSTVEFTLTSNFFLFPIENQRSQSLPFESISLSNATIFRASTEHLQTNSSIDLKIKDFNSHPQSTSTSSAVFPPRQTTWHKPRLRVQTETRSGQTSQGSTCRS